MSHCATQIRTWVFNALTAATGLPDPVVGTPRQIASNTDYVYIKTIEDLPEPITETTPTVYAHALTMEVVIVANSYDEVDTYSVLVEEALWNYAAYPAKTLDLNSRSYEEDKTTDRDYVALTLSFTARYHTTADDAETFI